MSEREREREARERSERERLITCGVCIQYLGQARIEHSIADLITQLIRMALIYEGDKGDNEFELNAKSDGLACSHTTTT